MVVWFVENVNVQEELNRRIDNLPAEDEVMRTELLRVLRTLIGINLVRSRQSDVAVNLQGDAHRFAHVFWNLGGQLTQFSCRLAQSLYYNCYSNVVHNQDVPTSWTNILWEARDHQGNYQLRSYDEEYNLRWGPRPEA